MSIEPVGDRLPATPRKSIVAEFAEDLTDAYTIAKALCSTSFVPKEFRGKPEEAAAAILTGSELGLSPMSAFRAVHVINGKPTLSAAVMRAVVQANGHDIWVAESSPEKVTVCARRSGAEHVESSTWTIQRAKAAGLTGKDNWRNHPEAMLIARATAQVARLVAADLLHGVYTDEESDGESGGGRAPVKRAPKHPAAAVVVPDPPDLGLPPAIEASTQGPAVDEPPLDDEPDPAQEGDRSPMLNTRSALAKRMFVALKEVGCQDSEDMHTECSAVLGREITSSKELTEDDARRVIASCEEGDRS